MAAGADGPRDGRRLLAPGSRPDLVPRAGEGARYLAFRVGAEYYAAPLTRVREILKVQPVTEVPRAPADILGVISVHGQVTTLVDLRLRLGVRPTPPGRLTRILVVGTGEEDLGILVDEVTQVLRIADTHIEPATTLGGDYGPHVAGVARPPLAGRSGADRADDLIILLDLGILLAP